MFIREFAITRYGPLDDYGKFELDSFNLFYAPNEKGKTLTIDALMRMFFKSGELRAIKGVERVAENPEGYMLLEAENRGGDKNIVPGNANTTIKLPEAGAFNQLFDISAFEFRNIFLIRDSDLSILKENEFYQGVTNRLTGLRTEDIKKVKDKVLEIGRITPGGEFRDLSPEKLKSKYNQASELLEQAEFLLAELLKEGYGRIETDLLEVEEKIRAADNKLGRLNLAYYREFFEKAQSALWKLENARFELNKLENYRHEDYQAWHHAEANLGLLSKQLEHNRNELARAAESLQEARKSFKDIERELKATGYQKDQCTNQVEPLLGEYDRAAAFLSAHKSSANNLFLRKTALLSTLVVIVSLIGTIIQPYWWLLLFLFISLAVTGYSLINIFNDFSKESRLTELDTQVRVAAENIGLSGSGISEVRTSVSEIKKRFALQSERLKDLDSEIKWWVKEDDRLRKEEEKLLSQIREEENKIGRIKLSVSVQNADHYAAQLGRKQELTSEKEKQKSILGSLLGEAVDPVSEEELIFQWEKRVDDLKEYEHSAPELNYEEKTVEKVKEELENLQAKKSKLEELLRRRGDDLRDLEKKYNEIVGSNEDGYLVCQTLVDLEGIIERLKKWLKTREEERKSAVLTAGLFDRLAEKELEKISGLFGLGNPASFYFNRITGGRYRGVVIDSGTGLPYAVLESGEKLEVSKLSGGAYDQLYFSIRLAFGEKLLAGEKGFFILDDPFIKADSKRLEAMLNLLDEICDAGWQIIYFSAKDEVREAMAEKIIRGAVKEFAL